MTSALWFGAMLARAAPSTGGLVDSGVSTPR